jgi:phospholipid-transporting ATPase
MTNMESQDKGIEMKANVYKTNLRKSSTNQHSHFDREKQIKFDFGNEQHRLVNRKHYKTNMISTTKYNVFSWIPKSLFLQFQRAANIYFLVISILTFFYFSPKSAVSMVGTFAIVLVFTMLKEGYEDIKRYKQDKEINEKMAKVYSQSEGQFVDKQWQEICIGDVVYVAKEDDIPADLLLVYSSDETGLCFLETMGLDGETNLKEKMCPNEKIFKAKVNEVTSHDNSNLENSKIEVISNINQNLTDINKELGSIEGSIICDKPNDNLEKWTCNLNITVNNRNVNVLCELKQIVLKGCKLKNTNFILGICVYSGHNTKIMKNAKSPPIKVSNVMKVMNILLYSVFFFQFLLCVLYALAYVIWQGNEGYLYKYLYLYNSNGQLISPGYTGLDWFIKYLTFLVAYSHLIPISLYVALELVKMLQSVLISKDMTMYDELSGKTATARTSDLIEELGQVEFVFSDKTGTLTKNEMEFRKCSINHKIYGTMNSNQAEIIDDEKPVIRSINGDTRAWDLLVKGGDDNLDKAAIEEYFQLLAICHSAYVEEKKGQQVYQSSSPDEVALVLGAEGMGFKFMKKTMSTIEIQDYKGQYQIWNLIIELPFDSTRKRMSVIIQKNNPDAEGDDNYYLLTKGADSAMLSNLTINESEKKLINSHLDEFAKEGLRTLVMGKKPLSKDTVMSYKEKYNNIRSSTDEKKDDLMMELFKDIEKDLRYIGCSAIEDKLQDGVGETIESLMNANIRVWVLTGDKKETAIEIGKSCKLILDPSEMDAIDLAIGGEGGATGFKHRLQEVYAQYQQYIPEEGDSNRILAQPEKKIYMIIDGTSLAYVLSDDKLKKKFFKVGLIANSVICCRVSPIQKSLVVKLAKDSGKWITLSIGDGANDVPMIMEAHIGIGISGKEGTQAVRSADYAISQFRFLKRLLFVHGRWGYRRISLFICYYFYKNIILVFTELYFAIYNGFSGQIFFPDMLPLMYNSFWSSWPCIFNYSIERDVDDELSMDNPVLYKAGQAKFYFNLKNFWTWIIMSIFHGAMVYFGTLYVKKIQKFF